MFFCVCVCSMCAVVQIIGVAAQDFNKTRRNKWETMDKTMYTSYVWSQFAIPGLPDQDGLYASLQVKGVRRWHWL